MKKLWDRREELGIYDIRFNEFWNTLDITVYWTQSQAADNFLTSQELKEKQEKFFFEQLNDNSFSHINIQFYTFKIPEVYYEKGMDNLEEFIEPLKKTGSYDMDWDSLYIGLQALKEAYPNYDYVNLFYRIAGKLDYEAYLGFDTELLEFVDSLETYIPSFNIMDELAMGDPERLELKRLLREYKELYPDKSYQELYETYLEEKNLLHFGKASFVDVLLEKNADGKNILEEESTGEKNADKEKGEKSEIPLGAVIVGLAVCTVTTGVFILRKYFRKNNTFLS